MELRIMTSADAPRPAEIAPAPAPASASAPTPHHAAAALPAETAAGAPEPDARPSFATWLLGQSKSGGTLGELAKAAKLDRGFPKAGSADDVRARFNAAGADGDAFEALDDAERDYDRSS